jgi:hypothetical protein
VQGYAASMAFQQFCYTYRADMTGLSRIRDVG